MSRQAQRRLRDRGLVVPLVRGTSQQLPFAAGSFQSVAATFPSETIIQGETLDEVNRVLSSDGVFVIVPMACITGNGPINRALELTYQITGQRETGTEQIEQRLRAAGFRAMTHWRKLPDSRVMLVIANPTMH
jgi:hypothetical protein